MSKEEQHNLMGRTVEEYANVGRDLTALLSKADRIKKELQRFASYLGSNEPYSSLDLRQGAKPPDFATFPTRDEYQSTVEEALSLLKRKQELKDQLKGFGVEPKD
jgi:hypothetical protein